jgi:hypothetical protein
MRASLLALAFALPPLFAPDAVAAQASLFARRATLDLPPTGVVRIALPDEVVRASGPALGDLRVLDDEGRAIPYAIDRAPAVDAPRTDLGALTPVEARQSAERAEGVSPLYHEAYDLELPREPAPGAYVLILTTASAHFTADAVVTRAVSEGEPEHLAARSLFRLGSGAEQLEIPLPARASGRVRITLSNESGFLSPAFALCSLAPPGAPSLVFDSTGAFRPLRAYFGGGRAIAASYIEAEGLLAVARTGATTGHGTFGAIEPNPSSSTEPALAFAMTPGPRADVEAYARRARVAIPSSREGLTRVRLPPTVGANDDVRLVDEEGRQWPYVRSSEDEEERVALDAQPLDGAPHLSRYAVELPDPLDLRGLLVEVDAAYVDRAFTIRHRGAHGEAEIWRDGRLQRQPGDRTPLRISIDRDRVEGFELEIVDGDDAPLALTLEALAARQSIFAMAPPGEYRLLFDVPRTIEETAPPSYEIERARALILAVPAADAEVGVAEANPDFSPPSPYSGSKRHDLLLWLVLGAAIVVLGALTFRLVRAAPPPSEGSRDV